MKRWPVFLLAVALISLVVVPMPASTQNGTDRPFKATFTGWVTYQFPGTSPSNCTVVTTLTEATGQVTHMGEVTAGWSHCPAEPGYVNDGRLTITAANGDMLFGKYDYDPASKVPSIPITWIGGTGRFTNASGAVVGTYNVIPQFIAGCNPNPNPFPCYDFTVPWPWSATSSGTITY